MGQVKSFNDIIAHEYKVNATKVALHLLREPDIFETNMKLFCAKDLEDAFIAGAEWQSRQMAWISVNDKLPEYGHIIDDLTIYSHTKNVIVLYKNGCIGKGKRIYVNEINKKGWQ